MPTLMNPSKYNVSAWPGKIDCHPKSHMAVFGDMGLAATTLYTVGNVLHCFQKKFFFKSLKLARS